MDGNIYSDDFLKDPMHTSIIPKYEVINPSAILTDKSLVFLSKEWIFYNPINDVYQIFGSEFRVKRYWRRHTGTYDIEHRKFNVLISSEVSIISDLKKQGLSSEDIISEIYNSWNDYYFEGFKESNHLISIDEWEWSGASAKERLEFYEVGNYLQLNEEQLRKLKFIDAY